MSESPREESITARASRAFGWSFGNTAASRLGTLAIGVALARVLGPDEFGIFAIATVTQLAILSFNELGVSLAVIRWREAPAVTAPTINTIAVGSSAILTGAVLFAAPWVSTALGDVRATPVVQVLAVSILLNGLVATPAAILQREFMQKQRTIADQVNTWLGAGLSLLFALLGWGAMSLALGRLIASFVFCILIWRWSPVRYRFGWNPAIVRRLFGFGLPLAASSVVVFASGYADQMIVGSTLGAQELGFYVLAFNLASWPVSIFSQPLRAVAPAAFSALKHDPARTSRNFTRVLAILSSVAIPACLAISGAAEPVVGFVYGAQWIPTAQILIFTAAFAAVRIWFELAYDFVVVQGRSSLILIIQVSIFVVALPLMTWGARGWGAEGVAAAQLITALVIGIPLYLLALARAGIRPGGVLKPVAVPTLAGLATWAIGWAVATYIGPPFLACTVAGLVAVGVIAGLCFLHRADIRVVVASARGRLA